MTDGQSETLAQQAADAKAVVYKLDVWEGHLRELDWNAERAIKNNDPDALHIATIERLAVRRAMDTIFKDADGGA
jgi:hypothetical protein